MLENKHVKLELMETKQVRKVLLFSNHNVVKIIEFSIKLLILFFIFKQNVLEYAA